MKDSKNRRNSIRQKQKKLLINIFEVIKEEANKENKEDNTSNNENSKINFSNISENQTENEDDSYMEKQLSLLLEVFATTYEKKTYPELIKDIEEKEILLCSKSIMSFKIMIIKVKCLMKVLLNEYDNLLKFANNNYHELDNVIQKIQNEFQKISKMVINNNTYEFEILTQIYCKFLFLLSKISLKKEDSIKSLGFISLGINMLKAFFIRKQKANDIKTYIIYSKLLLAIINILIGDNNYELALLYSRLLLKVIEASQQIIHFNNQDNNKENKISPMKVKKFIRYAGFAFLYIGGCLEQFENNIQAFEAYKQAKYFLDKGSISGNPFKNINIVSISNCCNYFTMEVFEKLKLKFEKEKMEAMQRQKILENLKRKQKYQLLQNEKQIRLKLIASGYRGDPFKYNKLEEKLDKLLLPSSILYALDKIDDELMSFVYTYYNQNKKNKTTSFKNRISISTKKLISRYELYNILMSKDFRDFLMKTKKLQFNNPKKGSESISIIQRFLNNKMEIQSEIKQRNRTHKKTIKVDKSLNSMNTLNIKTKDKTNDKTNTLTIPTTDQNSNRDEEKEKFFTLENNNRKRKKSLRLKLMSLPKQDNSTMSRNTLNNGSSSLRYILKSKNLSTSRKRKNMGINELECDFERKNFDKNLMTKNYLKKYHYYENLSNKELKLHKHLLEFRNNNTLYNPKRASEDKESKVITREEINNIFLFINEDVKEKTNTGVKDDDLEMLKDSFANGDNNKMGIKVKSAMSKVINKYILERKKLLQKKNVKILNDEEIKQLNEKNLLQLNYSIKNINSNISHINLLTGNKLLEKIQ